MSDSSVFNPVSVNERWRIPFDVVSGIMAVSQRRTISTLMKTCRALYTEGLRHLLSHGIQLKQSEDIASFANFMLTENPWRFTHLRKLVLKPSWLFYHPRLIDLLTYPYLSLETLVLHDVDMVLAQYVGMREAVSQLKTIKQLVVLGVQEESAWLIQSISSQLESISISFDLSALNLPDIPSTLIPFSNTLHTLLINSGPNVLAHVFLRDVRPRDFPHVRTFGVVWDDSVPKLLASAAFAKAFPALKHLQLIPTEHPEEMLSDSIVRLFDRLQILPRDHIGAGDRAQKSGHRAGIAPGSSLPALDECSGSLYSVYTLRIYCALSTLRLWQPIHASDLAALSAVLEDTRPRHLYLIADVHVVQDLFVTLSVLKARAPPHIELEILSHEGSQTTQGDVCCILEPLFECSPPAGLAGLRVHFGPGIAEQLRSESPPSQSSAAGDIVAGLTRWASSATPPLAFMWTCFVDEDQGRWPYLGQISRCDEYEADDACEYEEYMREKGYFDCYL